MNETLQETPSEKELERRKKFSKASLKHGAYKTKEYTAWLSMRGRCLNPKHPCFKHYGKRGITVCERWNHFERFIEDMGKRPDGHELERRDNDGNYEPSNCYWATRRAQMRNTRRTILVTLNGKTQCLKDWCAELGIKYSLAIARISYGYEPVRALLQKPWQRHWNKL